MAEIMRRPVRFSIDGKECDAFDEDHSLADIARWIMTNRVDGEEVARILGEMLEDE